MTPMTEVERAKALLVEIDGIARDRDRYEYGLPLFHAATMARLVDRVVAHAAPLAAELDELRPMVVRLMALLGVTTGDLKARVEGLERRHAEMRRDL